ncbi:MAG: acetaldehyde dehydrogenase (acetylating) [Acidobacteria bacterium 13_1_40CM_2_56_5]|nr:MAG: acetaldehyde dehydrogenase (acetylating) [Acidobacteria bacterium 13_1_40CM_2_56_5]
MDKDLESIQEARSLLQAAHDAWLKFENFTEEQVERVLLEISKAGIANAEPLARLAVEETGYGNVEHKTLKNLFCADDVYRAIRPMKTVGIVSEDKEKKVFEVASPIGVIAAIIPSTNPTSTAIYKALIALKGRNAIVFSPHPSAAKCIGETSRLLAVAAEQAGAPKGVISCMKVPTMEGTQELMKNERTALILATGGTGLVKAAYSAGKPAFGVGPGNVPSYVEKTADLTKAVRDILTGKCFDNGTLCSSEQAIICDEAVKDTVLQELQKQGAHVCSYQEKAQLERTIQTPRRTLNTKIVGKAATKIAEMAGFSVSAGTRALVAHADGVGPDYPISMEKLSPILAFYVVKDWKEGCAKCIEILNFGGLGHTLSLHTRDEEVVRQFALYKPAFRICVNTPAALGAVGYTTNLFPSMTLGCGAAGGNITSDNISPLHLINLKRVAYGVRDVAAGPPPRAVAATATVAGKRATIEHVVDQWLGGRAPIAPPLSSYTELEPPPPKVEKKEIKPVGFVCEDDVRSAILTNSKITIGKKTIVTPSARDLGEANDTFVLGD